MIFTPEALQIVAGGPQTTGSFFTPQALQIVAGGPQTTGSFIPRIPHAEGVGFAQK